MKKILEDSLPKRYHRVLGVDPSSFKVACTLIEHGEPQMTIALNLGDGDIYQRIYQARKRFPKVLDIYKPDYVGIEQSIFVQNPETSRKLSYVVGCLMAEVLYRHIPMDDVPPSQWKAYLGVKPLTKSEKNEILEKLGQTDGRKEIDRIKKSRCQDILRDRFPWWRWEDDDIADSCGIALYSWSIHGVD